MAVLPPRPAESVSFLILRPCSNEAAERRELASITDAVKGLRNPALAKWEGRRRQGLGNQSLKAQAQDRRSEGPLRGALPVFHTHVVYCYRGSEGCAMLRAAIALLMLLVSSVAQAEKRIALLIGNEAYTNDIGRLTNPHNDVALLEQALHVVEAVPGTAFRSTSAPPFAAGLRAS
jgi:hypothetical protein